MCCRLISGLWLCDDFLSFLVLQSSHCGRASFIVLVFSRNSVESDHECTSRIYFDNVGDTVTLTLYNMALALYSATLTSQKPC